MKKAKTVSIILCSLVTLITLSMASKFLMAREYFVYHAEASGLNWVDIPKGLQMVYLAVFKICGAGFLSTGLGLTLLISIPYTRYSQRWSYYAIPGFGLIFWSITLAMTLYVQISTGANTPWRGSSLCIFLLVLGFAVSVLDPKRHLTHHN